MTLEEHAPEYKVLHQRSEEVSLFWPVGADQLTREDGDTKRCLLVAIGDVGFQSHHS